VGGGGAGGGTVTKPGRIAEDEETSRAGGRGCVLDRAATVEQLRRPSSNESNRE